MHIINNEIIQYNSLSLVIKIVTFKPLIGNIHKYFIENLDLGQMWWDRCNQFCTQTWARGHSQNIYVLKSSFN
jgi:hypothetical protein